jgi:hypothetical protein
VRTASRQPNCIIDWDFFSRSAAGERHVTDATRLAASRAPAFKEAAGKVLSIGGQEVQIMNSEKLYYASQIKRAKLELVKYFAKTRLPTIMIMIDGTNLWS